MPFDASLSLAFDIFQNPETGYPSNNFVRVGSDRTVVADGLPGLPLASGEFLHAQLLVQAVAGGVDLTLVLTPDGGVSAAAVDGLFVPGYVPYEARVAFWARTRALTADHDLDNVAVQFMPAVPEPGTAALVVLGLVCVAASRESDLLKA